MIWITLLVAFVALFAYAMAFNYCVHTVAGYFAVFNPSSSIDRISTGVVYLRALITAVFLLVGIAFNILAMSLYVEVMA